MVFCLVEIIHSSTLVITHISHYNLYLTIFVIIPFVALLRRSGLLILDATAGHSLYFICHRCNALVETILTGIGGSIPKSSKPDLDPENSVCSDRPQRSSVPMHLPSPRPPARARVRGYAFNAVYLHCVFNLPMRHCHDARK